MFLTFEGLARKHSSMDPLNGHLFPLDKATSQLLLETDWESILQICDLIRQGDTQ